jgi:uncharacterized protein YfdQ (DUF2303 family)
MSMEENSNGNGAAVLAIAELAQQATDVTGGQVNGVNYVVVPSHMKVEWLDKYLSNREAPIRKEATVGFTDANSLIDYYKLFSDEGSRIWADPKSGTITVIFDYHMAGTDTPARWGKHRAVYGIQTTTEWNTWLANNAKPMSQLQFAEFIEDNAADILSAADMLAVSREMEAKKDVAFASSTRLQSGQVAFKYTEEVKATVGGGTMTVPDGFEIRLPVYQGGEPQKLYARLRYRINDQKLQMSYHLLRPQIEQEKAFAQIVKMVQTGTGQSIFIGSPSKG